MGNGVYVVIAEICPRGRKTIPQVSLYGLFLGCLGCFLVWGLSLLYGAVNGLEMDVCIFGHKKAPYFRGFRSAFIDRQPNKKRGINPPFGFILLL